MQRIEGLVSAVYNAKELKHHHNNGVHYLEFMDKSGTHRVYAASYYKIVSRESLCAFSADMARSFIPDMSNLAFEDDKVYIIPPKGGYEVLAVIYGENEEYTVHDYDTVTGIEPCQIMLWRRMKDIIFAYSMGNGKYLFAYMSDAYSHGGWFNDKFDSVPVLSV